MPLVLLVTAIIATVTAIYFYIEWQREKTELTAANQSIMRQLNHLSVENTRLHQQISEGRVAYFQGVGETNADPRTTVMEMTQLNPDGAVAFPIREYPAERVEWSFRHSPHRSTLELYTPEQRKRVFEECVDQITKNIARTLVDNNMVAFHIILDPTTSPRIHSRDVHTNIPSVTLSGSFYGHRFGRPLKEVFGDAFPVPAPPPGELIVTPAI
jgi:hypothetical protein